MEINLKNKVAVITGGTAGIGYAIAELFGQEGAKVAICSRKQVNIDRAVDKLQSQGIEVLGVAFDVADHLALFAFADQVEERFGGIDIWVSNAGILLEKRIVDTSLKQWQNLMNINLNSVFCGGHIAYDKLKKRGGGVLINAASFSSVMPSVGSGAYAASKSAIVSMTKSLAAELAPHNIRVVGYIPGVIETPMTKSWIEKSGEFLAGHSALQRVGKPEEIADAILFLASEKASFITGICLEISGGKFCVQNPADAWQ